MWLLEPAGVEGRLALRKPCFEYERSVAYKSLLLPAVEWFRSSLRAWGGSADLGFLCSRSWGELTVEARIFCVICVS